MAKKKKIPEKKSEIVYEYKPFDTDELKKLKEKLKEGDDENGQKKN